MTFRLLVSAMLAVAGILIAPHAAFSQSPSAEQLLARVRQLERRVDELEQRLRRIESQKESQPATETRAPTGNWRDIDNWRRLKIGMTMNQVSDILGRPEKVDAGLSLIFWYWGYPSGGEVFFDNDTNKVRGWSEPSR